VAKVDDFCQSVQEGAPWCTTHAVLWPAAATRIEPDLDQTNPGSDGTSVAPQGSMQKMLHLLEIQGRMQPEV
jgi:hypothetical protein